MSPPTHPLPHPIAEFSARVVIEGSGQAFACRPGQPILEAGYAAGVGLPYACRRGICGLCAADLVQGQVTPIDALPMTNGHCSPTQVLLCRCTPAQAEVVIRPGSWEPLATLRRLPPL